MAKKTTTTPPPKKTTTTASKKPTSSAKKTTASASKKTTPAKKPAPAKPAAAKKRPATGSGGMGIFAVIVVIAACAVIAVSFFLPFFTVSLTGSVSNSYLAQFLPGSLDELNTDVSGIEAALGRNGDTRVAASPFLFLVLFLAVALLAALCVPKLRKKQGFFRLPVIGGMAIVVAIIGLIVLYRAYSSTMGYLIRELETSNAVLSLLGSVRLSIHAGIGFVMTVIAHVVLLVMPIADRCFRRRK